MGWGEQTVDATDYADALHERVVGILRAIDHVDCPYLKEAKYVPESGAVVCGCGQFAPWSDSGDNPPWSEADSDYADAYQDSWGPGEPTLAQSGGDLERRQSNSPNAAADPIASALALIDPTQVYGPDDIERHILDVLWRLETGALWERETVVAAYEAKMTFERKFNARVAVSEQSSADKRKAQAMVDCDAEYEAMQVAAMVKEAAKQTMHNLRAVLSGYQSTARSVGSAYQAGGSQGGPPQEPPRY